MAKTLICDICKKPILFDHPFSPRIFCRQYKLKYKCISSNGSRDGLIKERKSIDICNLCRNRMIAYIEKEIDMEKIGEIRC